MAGVEKRRCAWQLVAAVLVLLVAYLLPRAVALQGISLTAPLAYVDMAYHLASADLEHRRRALADQLDDPYLRRFPPQRMHPGRWPAGVYHLARPWVAAFGPLSIWTVQLTNGLFALVLLGGVVGLGWILGGVRLGLWAALLTVLCPALVAASWYFSSSYPLVAMVAVGLVLLWQTRGLSRWPWCLALAAWSVLGLWINLTYALYLLGPTVAALVVGLRQESRRRVGLNLLAVVVVVGGLAPVLLDLDPRGLLSELVLHARDAPMGEQAFGHQLIRPWTWAWLASMPEFAVRQYPWPLLLLALPGLVWLHGRRGPRARWLLLTFFWSTVVLLTLLTNKMERYLQPLYPLLCLLTAWWIIARVPRRWGPVALLWAAAAYGAVLYVAWQHPVPWLDRSEAADARRYLYEQAMPGPRTLARLRQLTYHPRCDLRPLVQQIEALVRKHPSVRPLALARHRAPMRFDVFASLNLAVMHALRDRFVVGIELWIPDELTEPARRSPQLVVVHRPDVPVPEELERVDGATATLTCEQEGRWVGQPVALTLARGLSPPVRGGSPRAR
jgi:4-amino-4-deoxy-L-arabinose transferase-like glycosyltransferase